MKSQLVRGHADCHATDHSNTHQLLIIVTGQGGTGKSVLIKAITETFAYHRQESRLAKCAPSGIAAIHIGGSTIHHWAGLGIQRLKNLASSSKTIAARRNHNIVGKHCLIIDEMSMIHDTLFTDIAKVIAHVKKAANEGDERLPFSGMHVILMGNFHQFPPVGRTNCSLYSLTPTANMDAIYACTLYKQFEKVVCLQEQIRIQDPVWLDILSRLRVGDCTEDDIRIVKTLILNQQECPKTDFGCLPWSEAILITTRHAVREAWNAAFLDCHCKKTGNIKFIVSSEDQLNGGVLRTIPGHVRHHIAKMREKDTGKLPDRIEIAIGMKVMICFNLSAGADLADGTRGTVKDIFLDPREEALQMDEVRSIKLKYPPAMILFEPDGGSKMSAAFVDQRRSHSITIPDGQIPITPYTVIFCVTLADGSKHLITRTQYGMTGGYAFTDIKSQGQMMGPILIDLRAPPTGQISPFSAYVALSRSRGRDNICLLTDFDNKLFTTHPDADLAIEMERLEALASLS